MKFSEPHLLFILVFSFTSALFGIEPSDTSKKEILSPELKLTLQIPATAVKDQNKTSTCWSFSTISLLESELLRTQGKVYDLSEMFVVRKVYLEKAERYIRMHGSSTFAGGGEPNDVINCIKKYGIVPEQAYSGLLKDSLFHSHFLLDNALKNYVDALIKNPENNIVKDWEKGFNAILDNYLGKSPKSFVYEGKEYTAETFAASLNLIPDDFILLSSFRYKPYYKPFILEVPDNWSWGEVYNITPDNMISTIDSALTKGYSLTWSADYSEPGFSYSSGLAVVPKTIYGSDSKINKQKLQKFSKKEKDELFFDLKNPVDEYTITPENTQEAFDNYSTTDDHGMHIVGKALNKNGSPYYLVKNSWGTDNLYGGYLYVSEAYIRYKTISLMLNKNALPVSMKTKLSL